MRKPWRISALALVDLGVVTWLAFSSIWLFGEDHIAYLTTNAPALAFYASTFVACSLLGSVAAWKLRLPQPLSTAFALPLWIVGVAFIVIGPQIALRLSGAFGLLAWFVWVLVSSYIWGFFMLNTRKWSTHAG
jgi:hypothetical protein